MSLRKPLAAAALTAALAIGLPAASASAAPIILPGPIQLPNAQCPLWVGLNIIPVGCVPWAIIIEDRLHGLPF
jgi:hypothetical protein